jgi:hypothetical protein
MIDLALWINVLPWAHYHCLGRGHVDQGRFAGICVGYPYRNGEAVGCAAEEDWYCAREVEEQRGGAIGKS